MYTRVCTMPVHAAPCHAGTGVQPVLCCLLSILPLIINLKRTAQFIWAEGWPDWLMMMRHVAKRGRAAAGRSICKRRGSRHGPRLEGNQYLSPCCYFGSIQGHQGRSNSLRQVRIVMKDSTPKQVCACVQDLITFKALTLCLKCCQELSMPKCWTCTNK